EGEDSEISLPHDDPEIVKLMLDYLYTLDYSPKTHSDSTQDEGDTMSTQSSDNQWGQVGGTSAVSAFGGPPAGFGQHSGFGSAFTSHAMPQVVSFAKKPYRGKRPGQAAAPGPSPLATAEPNLALHAKVYGMAEKYGINGLKALALDKFKIQATKHWDSMDFPEAIHIVYTSTPSTDKDMRDVVADVLGWYGVLLDKPEIEAAVLEINGLAYELLKRSRRTEPEW
ncbi:hypothetical protein LTR28_010014, partial [Elasticomyces elasticus]